MPSLGEKTDFSFFVESNQPWRQLCIVALGRRQKGCRALTGILAAYNVIEAAFTTIISVEEQLCLVHVTLQSFVRR